MLGHVAEENEASSSAADEEKLSQGQ